MSNTATANKLNLEAVERFLRVHGWIFEREIATDRHWSKGDYRLVICQDIDTISVFDMTPEAEGFIPDVSTLQSLEETLVSIGAMEWECPNCGEAGGEPRTAYSREFQGCSEHGGMVEFEERGCSRCIRGRW